MYAAVDCGPKPNQWHTQMCNNKNNSGQISTSCARGQRPELPLASQIPSTHSNSVLGAGALGVLSIELHKWVPNAIDTVRIVGVRFSFSEIKIYRGS